MLSASLRRAVEAELSESERAVVSSWLQALALPPDGWDVLPGLAGVLRAVAAARVAEAHQRVHGGPEREAIQAACRRLGLKPRSLTKQYARWAGRLRDKLSPLAL